MLYYFFPYKFFLQNVKEERKLENNYRNLLFLIEAERLANNHME